jgi:hypothetical protein
MNAIRLPSGDQDASETAVGNFTGVPPTVTVSVPSEMSGVPAAYLADAGVEGADEAGADGFEEAAEVAEVAATGVPVACAEDLPHADAISATEVAAAAVTSRRREEERLTCGPFPKRLSPVRRGT